MSYGVTSIGRKEDVVAEVVTNKYVPDSVKGFIKTSVEAIPDPIPGGNGIPYEAADSVLVEASGHEPGTHNIKIQRFNAAVNPAPIAPPPPGPGDATNGTDAAGAPAASDSGVAVSAAPVITDTN